LDVSKSALIKTPKTPNRLFYQAKEKGKKRTGAAPQPPFSKKGPLGRLSLFPAPKYQWRSSVLEVNKKREKEKNNFRGKINPDGPCCFGDPVRGKKNNHLGEKNVPGFFQVFGIRKVEIPNGGAGVRKKKTKFC